MGSSASRPVLAGQDALLPPMDALGQGEQLCSAPSPAVIPLPAGCCWSQLGSAGPRTMSGLCASPGAPWLGLGPRTGVLSVPAAPHAAPGPYWMLTQGTRGWSQLRTSPCRRMRPPRSHPGHWAQGTRPRSAVMGAGPGEVLGLGGPCAPPGEPNGGEQWWEGTGGLSTLRGGGRDSHTCDRRGEDGDGTEQRWGGWGCPGGSAPTPQLCVHPPHGALTLFPPQPRSAPAALRQEQ